MQIYRMRLGSRHRRFTKHYVSKEAILDSIYDYFIKQCSQTEEVQAEQIPILKDETAEDIVKLFTHPGLDPHKANPDILQIILTRRYIDERARQICQEYIINAGFKHIHTIIAVGREAERFFMNDNEAEILVWMYMAY